MLNETRTRLRWRSMTDTSLRLGRPIRENWRSKYLLHLKFNMLMSSILEKDMRRASGEGNLEWIKYRPMWQIWDCEFHSYHPHSPADTHLSFIIILNRVYLFGNYLSVFPRTWFACSKTARRYFSSLGTNLADITIYGSNCCDVPIQDFIFKLSDVVWLEFNSGAQLLIEREAISDGILICTPIFPSDAP